MSPEWEFVEAEGGGSIESSLDGSSRKRARKEESPSPSRRPYKKRSEITAKINQEEDDSTTACITERNEALTSGEKAIALRLAKAAFHSDNPYFMVVIQPNHVHMDKDRRLCIPAKFGETYFKREHGSAIIGVSDGRTWSIKYYGHRPKSAARFQCGWREFALENHLKVGDVCAFELIDETQLTFEVAIFRTSQDAKLSLCKASNDNATLTVAEKARALRIAEADFKSKYPYFILAMQPSYLITGSHRGFGLGLPSSFAKKYLKKERGDAILCAPNGQNWPINYYNIMRRGSIAKFYGGWREFVRGNKLKVGDVCAFELIETSNLTFKVSIFRVSKDIDKSNQSIEENNDIVQPTQDQPLTSIEAPGADVGDDVLGDVSAPPCFEVVITQIQAMNHNGVTVPMHYIRKHLKQPTEDIVLQIESRTWPVNLLSHPGYDHGRLCGGWRAFAKENSLQAGDICVFELAERDTGLFNVSILRANSVS